MYMSSYLGMKDGLLIPIIRSWRRTLAAKYRRSSPTVRYLASSPLFKEAAGKAFSGPVP
jgi:hypothetical protein